MSIRCLRGLLPVVMSIALGCQAGGVPLVGSAGPAMSIDVASVEQAVARANTVDWSSNTYNSKAILAAREARAQEMAAYRTQYANWPSTPIWTKNHNGHRISNALAYAFANVWAPGPQPVNGDMLMYMSNQPYGVRNFFIVDPKTGDPLNGAGWDALDIIDAPPGSLVDDSAITLSAKGTQALLVTTGGHFGALWTAGANAGTKSVGASLGGGRLTKGTAPFIDNSKYPGEDKRMSVWIASTDLLDTEGRLHNIEYDASRGTPWTAMSSLQVSGPAADGSAGNVTAAGFKASPVAWKGKVYVGDVNGKLWEYDVASGSARYWDLAPFSGVATDQILAPVAIEFDYSPAMNVTRIFVSCGLRVFWIDPVTEEMVPSQYLVVDTATNAPGNKLQASLDTYNYAGSATGAIYAATSISVGDTFNVSNPSIYNYEITGSYGLNSPSDGRPVSGYVRFTVPTNAFNGRLPLTATLTMTVDAYCIPDASDAGSIFRASNYLKNPGTGRDTGSIWTRSNIDWRTQPRLLVNQPFSSRTGPASHYDQITWNISGAIPRDGDNYTFVLRGNGKQYNGTACRNITSPGYYGYTAPVARRPRIQAVCSPFGADGAIDNQPILLSLGSNPRLYVSNSNAVFELNYQDTGTFADAAETHFSLTKAGRGGAGQAGVVSPTNKFIKNVVTTSLGRTGNQYYMYVCDENGNNRPNINKFSVPLARTANADNLQQVYELPNSSRRSTPYLTWDYFGGSLYFANQSGNGTVYRLAQ